jgi:hypothetical protein
MRSSERVLLRRQPVSPPAFAISKLKQYGTRRAWFQVMKEEMAFLKYRRDVVRSWPESPRKAVFLNAIEGRIARMLQESQSTTSAALRLAHPH